MWPPPLIRCIKQGGWWISYRPQGFCSLDLSFPKKTTYPWNNPSIPKAQNWAGRNSYSMGLGYVPGICWKNLVYKCSYYRLRYDCVSPRKVFIQYPFNSSKAGVAYDPIPLPWFTMLAGSMLLLMGHTVQIHYHEVIYKCKWSNAPSFRSRGKPNNRLVTWSVYILSSFKY